MSHEESSLKIHVDTCIRYHAKRSDFYLKLHKTTLILNTILPIMLIGCILDHMVTFGIILSVVLFIINFLPVVMCRYDLGVGVEWCAQQIKDSDYVYGELCDNGTDYRSIGGGWWAKYRLHNDAYQELHKINPNSVKSENEDNIRQKITGIMRSCGNVDMVLFERMEAESLYANGCLAE